MAEDTRTLADCAATPLAIRLGGEGWTAECGCGFRCPTTSDRRTALQAIDAHREGRT